MGVIVDQAPGITRSSEVLVKFPDEEEPEFVETKAIRRAPKPNYVFFDHAGHRNTIQKYLKGGALIAIEDVPTV